jgi:CRP-like cAMP-binding protein
MAETIFDQLPLFEGLTPRQQALIRPLFVPCDYYTDSMLFEQGDIAEFLYLVVRGEVLVVFKPDDGPAITVAKIIPGGVVGWSAALGSPTYTSGAMCTTYSQLLRVRGADLRKLCEQHDEVGLLITNRLADVIAQRLSRTHEQVAALLGLGLRNGVHADGGEVR